MSENELRWILQAHPAAQLEEYPAPDSKVQIANGSIVPLWKQVLLRFFSGEESSRAIHDPAYNGQNPDWNVLLQKLICDPGPRKPVSKEQLTLISKLPDEADNVINQLFQDPEASTDKRWYSTPETCNNPDMLNKIER